MNKNIKKVTIVLLVTLGVTLAGGAVALASGRGGGSINYSLPASTSTSGK